MFDIEKWVPFLVAKSHQTTFSLMKNAVEGFNLTPPQFATLSFLWKQDGINLHQLGSLMNVDRTTIGGIVERLEKLDYVKRESDPEDRRSWIVYVTDKGNRIQAEILKELNTVKQALDTLLTREEQKQLVKLLAKLRSNTINA